MLRDSLRGWINKRLKWNRCLTNLNEKDQALRNGVSSFLKKYSKLSQKSPIVIVWELGGFEAILRRDAIISMALNVRGYKTHFILCDGHSKACVQREMHKENVCEWEKSCLNCLNSMQRSAEKYNIEYSFASEYLDEKIFSQLRAFSKTIKLEDIKNYKYMDIDIAQGTLSSFIRYKKGYPTDLIQKDDECVYREYFQTSLVNTYLANFLIKKYKPVAFFTSHGMYSDYQPAVFMGVKNSINVMAWSSSFFDMHHYYYPPKSCKNLMPRRISDQGWEGIKSQNLTQIQEQRLNKFFIDRYINAKTSDTLNFFDKLEGVVDLKKKIGITNNNPIVCLFTHLNWDACIDFPALIFEDSYQWVIESVQKMIEIEDVNWLIKIHPVEMRIGNYYGVVDEIKRKIGDIPSHVKILTPDLKINSYGLYNVIDVGITIMGTVGVELPSFSKPVITAGRFHFAQKGFTIDPESKGEYFKLLENIKSIRPLSDDQVRMARRYAYSYFIERQIPLTVINTAQGHWGDLDLNKLDRLLPGNDPIIDKICEGIIYGKDVALDEKCFEYLEKIKEFGY